MKDKSNVTYDAPSLGSTYLDPSVQCSDSSVSSSSSITPSSGYSSYDILDQDSNDDIQSCHDSHQAKNRASKEAVSDSRSKSVPIISRKTNTQDYTTQIKPASHHSCSSSTQASVSTPWYSGREARTFREERDGSCNREKEPSIIRNKNRITVHSVQEDSILSTEKTPTKILKNIYNVFIYSAK